ncbi:MAG TPA: hypothetical protein PLW34_11040 [Termitinemataceae bacterium]|uniref:hypothetical protein n=1 Tax=Treponema sp. J25 TaxID=2094121 RepID=UPI0010523903|nr:hypothetical protein [Treponema sp. J25]TCW60151.1 hypothetical protein C5O22_13085 [Treponema sp. J25]HOK00082.1 hypothetical protein [Termitinemataceae bacterium]HOM24360.1 hypothetical protein [Termitinemataceae bacterium]HPQ01436.1 hypothetical protein [Termitinemataceae bacterium]
MKKIIIVVFSLILAVNLFGDGKYKEEDFIGSWYFIDGMECVDVKQWLIIEKVKGGLQVRYNDGKSIYAAVLLLTSDGRYVKGLLSGLGYVVIGKVQSISPFEHNGIGVDLSGGPDDILLGYFQKKEVLEKLIGKKLPAIQ